MNTTCNRHSRQFEPPVLPGSARFRWTKFAGTTSAPLDFRDSIYGLCCRELNAGQRWDSLVVSLKYWTMTDLQYADKKVGSKQLKTGPGRFE